MITLVFDLVSAAPSGPGLGLMVLEVRHDPGVCGHLPAVLISGHFYYLCPLPLLTTLPDPHIDLFLIASVTPASSSVFWAPFSLSLASSLRSVFYLYSWYEFINFIYTLFCL